MAEWAQILPGMGSATGQRDDVVHIRGRGPTAPAQWFFSQHQQPQQPPGGTVSALMSRGPVIRRSGSPDRFAWTVTGYPFSHGLTSSVFSPGVPAYENGGGGPRAWSVSE
jgi:hypothetical protein